MASGFSFPTEVAERLGFYVYALRDPRDGRVFYVGKGVGDRINSHGREAHEHPDSEKAKLRTIMDIERSGAEVELLLLRTGLDSDEAAFMVEQSVIDAFAADHHPLTNLVRGHHSGLHGLASLDAVIARYAADPAPPIPHPLLMVKINRGWRPDATAADIYAQTRGYWRIGANVRERAKYVLGVAFGVIRGAYAVDSWFPSPQAGEEGRWGFDGSPAPELTHVIGTHVRGAFKAGSQNPYRKYLDGYPGEPGAEPTSPEQPADR